MHDLLPEPLAERKPHGSLRTDGLRLHAVSDKRQQHGVGEVFVVAEDDGCVVLPAGGEQSLAEHRAGVVHNEDTEVFQRHLPCPLAVTLNHELSVLHVEIRWRGDLDSTPDHCTGLIAPSGVTSILCIWRSSMSLGMTTFTCVVPASSVAAR